MDMLLLNLIGLFVLFIVIVVGVKMAVKEALNEVKEDIIKEFKLRERD